MLGASAIARYALAEAYVVFTAAINEAVTTSDSFVGPAGIANELSESSPMYDYSIPVGVTITREIWVQDVNLGNRTFTIQY